MAISSNTKKLLLRIVLFLVYLLFGAGLFYGIENKSEREKIDANDFHKKYKNFTDRYKISKDDMLAFLKGLEEAMKLGYNASKGFNGSDEGWPGHYRWQFMNAFHFAGNVVTTIGYGHIAPLTIAGRFLCILYALFGIPLTGLTLRSIGNRISEFIASTIKSLDRRFYNRESEKLEIKTAIVAFATLWFIILVPAVGFSLIEDWAYQDAVYFCFVTLTTIGFGDFVPGLGRQKYEEGIEALLEFLNLIYMVLGLAVMSGVIVSISGVIEEKTKNFGVDPLEALRNIRVENLNSRALKKLGYKMGPGMGPPGAAGPPNHEDPNMNRRLPPKLAPRAIAVAAATPNDRGNMERSRSAEAMDFQGPTPVMYLNKQHGKPPCSKDDNQTVSPTASKRFNNKIAPVTLPENDVITDSSSKKLDLRKRSDHNSASTESAEEARASDDDSETKTIDELNDLREEAELDICEPVNHEVKNNLVVQVQVTPMPSPRESPVHAMESLDSISTNQKTDDPYIDQIETYEGSMKGSIDSSNAFQTDRNTAIDYSKTNETFERENDPPITNPFTRETTNTREAQNAPHKPKTNDAKNARTKNGLISKNHTKPIPKKGRTFKPVEHIDLGDKTVSKISR